MTKNIGTEISGIRLDELTDEQKDELALLVAERSVVFLRGQEGLSPKVQRDLGTWWGEVEVHVCLFYVLYHEGENRDRMCADDLMYSHKFPMYRDFLVCRSCGLPCKPVKPREKLISEIQEVRVDGIRKFLHSSLDSLEAIAKTNR